MFLMCDFCGKFDVKLINFYGNCSHYGTDRLQCTSVPNRGQEKLSKFDVIYGKLGFRPCLWFEKFTNNKVEMERKKAVTQNFFN